MMAGLQEQALWDAEIYQIEQTDPVVGGPPNLAQGQGITNVPHQALANRTAWLKTQIEALQQTLTDLTSGAPGAMDTLNELAAALGDDPNFSATVLNKIGSLESAANVVADGANVPAHGIARSRDGVIMVNPTDGGLVVSGVSQAELEADGFVTLIQYIRNLRPAPRNYLINGGYDIWQRGTVFTFAGYGGADRWANTNYGSTKTVSREAFAVGQTDVPGNPRYFERTVINSVAGNANYVGTHQRIEGVGSLAGRKATLTFWAKADGNKSIGVNIRQNFGTGGAPSPVNSFFAQAVNLTNQWARYDLVIDVPSIDGKSIGTGGNDCLHVGWWHDAGSDHAARSSGIGQQSGTFDVARVSLVEGDYSDHPDPFEMRSIGDELALCQRYFQKSYNLETAPGTAIGTGAEYTQRVSSSSPYADYYRVKFPTAMRRDPSIVIYSPVTGNSGYVRDTSAGVEVGVQTLFWNGESGFGIGAIMAGVQRPYAFHYTSDTEL
jgi:hypothetical protein